MTIPVKTCYIISVMVLLALFPINLAGQYNFHNFWIIEVNMNKHQTVLLNHSASKLNLSHKNSGFCGSPEREIFIRADRELSRQSSL